MGLVKERDLAWGSSSRVQLRQHRAARGAGCHTAWSAGAEVSTGRSLGESLLCGEDRLTSDREVKGPGAGGGRGRGRCNFGGKPQERKAGAPKVHAPGFSEGQKSRKHSTMETTGSAELRESSEAGGKPV